MLICIEASGMSGACCEHPHAAHQRTTWLEHKVTPLANPSMPRMATCGSIVTRYTATCNTEIQPALGSFCCYRPGPPLTHHTASHCCPCTPPTPHKAHRRDIPLQGVYCTTDSRPWAKRHRCTPHPSCNLAHPQYSSPPTPSPLQPTSHGGLSCCCA
jgi:hypothetical protein